MSLRSPAPPWTLRHIVAATDFSAAAGHAVERAARLAQEHGARLTLAHIVPASLWEDAGTRLAAAAGIDTVSPEAMQKTAAEHLQHHAAELADEHGLVCDVQVTAGRPVAELAKLAAAADLLVVGARGAHSMRDLMLGTTAQKLLRVSACPVLIVKRAPPFGYRNVLAPTDFSPAARAALLALTTALPNARLHLAHAFELPYDGLMNYAGVNQDAITKYRDDAQAQLLLDLAAWADGAGVAIERRKLHVEHGYPATCVERWIDALGIDLVALAAHGKSELEVAFLGSVSLHTVLAAACDVLLLRGPVLSP